VEHSPLAQFEVKTLFPLEILGFDASFTNSSAFMVLIVILISFFVIGGMSKASAIPSRWQSMVELVYEFISNMLHEAAGREARKFFPFVFSLFMFVLFANLIGMVPYTFTVTSHIAVTFALASVVFVGVTVLGFINHGLSFFKLFVPTGVPVALSPLLVVIELISYLTRPISLSVRLFANMMAGHTMLKVLAGFVGTMGVAGVLPLAFITALTGLEIIIAVLQAYVFAILTCIYLNDAYHIDH
jgi:F-type H+-transporting ATPase subunit a